MTNDMVQCPGCRLIEVEIEGPKHPYLLSSATCWDTYSKVLEKEYSNQAYMKVHRLTVDAYCAQHPGIVSPKTIQSINAHLVSLYLVLDRRLDQNFARKVIGFITNEYKESLKWLEPSYPIGEINCKDVLNAKSAAEHKEIVYQWAEEVWRSWEHVHSDIISLAEVVIEKLNK